MPLDAQARPIVDLLSSIFPDVGGAVTDAGEARRILKSQLLPRDGEPVARIEDRALPAPEGHAIPVRIYWPAEPSEANPLPIVTFLHGGGWVLCDLDTHDATCRTLANGAESIIVSVDYRLAPEHPFPAAFDDAYAALTWTREHASDLGGDPARIAVAGDSAGGNLAACVALAARDRGTPPLRAQLLAYPVIDASFARDSYRDNAEGYFLTAKHMVWYWNQYVPDPVQRSDVRVSPIHADDLSGVAPAYVITAECDPLRDEGEAYGARLRTFDVPVTVERCAGMFHGFFGMGEVLPGARAAMTNACAFLRDALQ